LGSPPDKAKSQEVEFSKKEVLREEVEIYGQPDHGCVEAGLPVPEICRELAISSATFYKWRAKFNGMDISMMARMKELEDENRRLKKMYLQEKLKAQIANEYLAKK
jgi:putative transposase